MRVLTVFAHNDRRSFCGGEANEPPRGRFTDPTEPHSHPHVHAELVHSHPHVSDIHHRHVRGRSGG